MAWVQILLLSVALGTTPPETKFIQVAPARHETERFERSTEQTRAIVLIQGLDLHVFKDSEVPKARFRSWQQPGSVLVETLAKEGDVFAFAYGQTVPVDEIAAAATLRDGIRQLKGMGYVHVVLVGHSAGGIVARDFVEDNPDAGVTKVIQICSPNGGSSWSRLREGLRPSQHAFAASLSKEVRTETCRQRGDKLIPDQVQFVCVIGTMLSLGDGVVSCPAQWPEDLQRQGIPAVILRTDHFSAVRTQAHAKFLAQLVCTEQLRWSIAEVETNRKKLLGVSPVTNK